MKTKNTYFFNRALSVILAVCLAVFIMAGCSHKTTDTTPESSQQNEQPQNTQNTDIVTDDIKGIFVESDEAFKDMLGTVSYGERHYGAVAVRNGETVYICAEYIDDNKEGYAYKSLSGNNIVQLGRKKENDDENARLTIWEYKDTDALLKVPQVDSRKAEEAVLYYIDDSGQQSQLKLSENGTVASYPAVLICDNKCIGIVIKDGYIHALTFMPELENHAEEVTAPNDENADDGEVENDETGNGKTVTGEVGNRVVQIGNIKNEKSDPVKDDAGMKTRLLLIAAAIIIVLLLAAVVMLVRKMEQKDRENRLERRKDRIQNTERLQKSAESSENPSGTPSVGTLHNIGKRPGQQDSMGVTELKCGCLAAVADGMGGLENGDKVSQNVIMTMLNSSDSIIKMTADNPLLPMVAAVNGEVNRMISSKGYAASGSTLIAVFAGNGYFHWVSVGDSRIYLYRGGSMIQINREHNYEADLVVDAVNGLVPFSEMKTHPKRNGLTSYIGMGNLEHVDGSLRPIKLCGGDRLILMSDGVYNTVPEQEIADIIKSSLSAQSAAETLESRVQSYNRQKQDNFTAIIIEF